MAANKIKPQGLQFPTKTVDANGWTVYDFGNFKQYSKRVTFSQTISTAASLSISSANLPVAVATANAVSINYAAHIAANSWALQIGREGTTGSTTLAFTAASVDGVSRSYTGYLDLVLTEL